MRPGLIDVIATWDTPTKVIAAVITLKTLALFIYSLFTDRRDYPDGRI